MGKALPDDEAIEAKMVTKAIERAQSTVEQRNAEIRKNVLKYDEVMNEQRKVIYMRRDQILAGSDLRAAAMDYLAEAVNALIERHCVSDAEDEEWDPRGPRRRARQLLPSTLGVEHARGVRGTDEMYDLVMQEATAHYDQARGGADPDGASRGRASGDAAHHRPALAEHLYEMDYLQEGINLRAMGQKDPLVEWQREGYEMFGKIMKGIADDFVRYVMHVQVVQKEPRSAAGPAERSDHLGRQRPDEWVPGGRRVGRADGSLDEELLAKSLPPGR